MNSRDENNQEEIELTNIDALQTYYDDDFEEEERVCLGPRGRVYKNGLAHCGFSVSFLTSMVSLGGSALILVASAMLPIEEKDKKNMINLGLILGGIGLSAGITAGLTYFGCTKKQKQGSHLENRQDQAKHLFNLKCTS